MLSYTKSKRWLAVVGLSLTLLGNTAQAQQFIGEVKLFAGNFAPLGYVFADGSLLAIADYSALFALIGTTYGGDGQTTFAVPDLRGRMPVHYGFSNSFGTIDIGQSWGSPTVALTVANLPSGVSRGDQASTGTIAVTNAVIPMSSRMARTVDAQTPFNGLGQAIELKGPYLGINYIISVDGVFPSSN